MVYSSLEADKLCIKYEEVEAVAGAFIVSESRCGICDASSQDINMPMHLIDDSELVKKPVGVPLSLRCCDHMDMLWTSRADLKPSKATGSLCTTIRSIVIFLPLC